MQRALEGGAEVRRIDIATFTNDFNREADAPRNADFAPRDDKNPTLCDCRVK